jgi:hypothetical protein
VDKPQAPSNVVPIRRSRSLLRPFTLPPAISIFDVPVYIEAGVKVANLLCALQAAGLRLRLDPLTGRFVIDSRPAAV